jgi:flagellar hook assembly protein FlgD
VEAEATGIGDDKVAFTYSLAQNHPNPFNPTTRIQYQIQARTHVSLTVYDVQGRMIKTLVNEVKSPGQFTADWDGTNNNGSRVSTGVYFYRLTAGSFVQTKKMVMLK